MNIIIINILISVLKIHLLVLFKQSIQHLIILSQIAYFYSRFQYIYFKAINYSYTWVNKVFFLYFLHFWEAGIDFLSDLTTVIENANILYELNKKKLWKNSNISYEKTYRFNLMWKIYVAFSKCHFVRNNSEKNCEIKPLLTVVKNLNFQGGCRSFIQLKCFTPLKTCNKVFLLNNCFQSGFNWAINF